MKLRLLLWYGLFFFALVMTACGGGASPDVGTGDPATTQATDAVPTGTEDPGPTQGADSVPTDSLPSDTSPGTVALEPENTPAPTDRGFNRRATGNGTAVVGGVSYTFEVYLCGEALAWSDVGYPDGSEETAFYLEPDGGIEAVRMGGAGIQADGTLFWIDINLNRRSGTIGAALSPSVPGDPARGWYVGSTKLLPTAIEYDASRFATVDGGIGFFNTENPSVRTRVTLEATCDTYGGTYDTASDLAFEMTGIPIPGPGQGVFVADDETFLFDPETCLISTYDGRVAVEGENDSYLLSIELAAEGGAQFVNLTLRDPYRRYGFLVIGEGPVVVEGSRIYTPEPFEMDDVGGQEPVLFSIDVTCPEIGT